MNQESTATNEYLLSQLITAHFSSQKRKKIGERKCKWQQIALKLATENETQSITATSYHKMCANPYYYIFNQVIEEKAGFNLPLHKMPMTTLS
jgi:hypothetical protein